MKRFLKYVVLFVVPVLCLLALGEAVVRHYPTSYALKHSLARERCDATRTLVFGNSRAYYGVLTDSLDHALNLANVSQTLEYDYHYLESCFAAHSSNLRNVIVQLDYSNVFDPPLEQSPWDAYRCTYYRLHTGYAKHSLLSRYGFELFNLEQFKRKLPLALTYAFTGKCQLDCDSTGFGITTTRRFDAGRMSHATANGLDRYNAINLDDMDYNVAYVHRIGEFCKAHNVRMILVSMPIWRELYRQKGHREEPLLAKLVEECRTRYGAEFRDYTADPRVKDEDFVDAVHLSPLGAAHFTRILDEDFHLDSAS